MTEEAWAVYRRRLIGKAKSIAPYDAEDVVQEVLCNYLQRVRVAPVITHPFLYLYGAVINRAMSALRRRPLVLLREVWVEDDIVDRLDDERDIQRIKAAGGEWLLEYYQWWYKPTPGERVIAHRLRNRLRRAIA